MDNPYIGASRHFLDRELATLRALEQAHATYAASVAVAREAAAYRWTQRELDDLIGALGDLRSDHIAPVIMRIEDSLDELDLPGERHAANAAGPKVI
ncbi:MAG: hypothetical protein KDE14_02950 [Rhodobacteraceae bacterium]|nr:hypothetical protein [Paracoccaceae bacterium]